MPMLTMLSDRFAGVTLPCAAAHAIGEAFHLVEHGVHRRHDVLAVDHDRGAARSAQRNVKHRPVFRHVDLLAAKHRVDARAQIRTPGELNEQAARLLVMRFFE